MENASHYKKISFLLLACLLCTAAVSASSLRQYTTRDGLSNPRVTAVYQDANALMWLGTSDGINTFDGLNMHKLFSGDTPDPFAGDTIGSIFGGGDDILWVQTNRNLYRLNSRTLEVETFAGFDLETRITSSATNEVFAIRHDNTIAYYVPGETGFRKATVSNLPFDSVMEIFVDNNNNLWIFTDDGNHRSYSISYENGELQLLSQSQFRHSEPLLWCFYEDGSVYFVDATLTFFEYNLTSRTKHYIQDIREDVLKYGEITSIIKHQNDFFIGFATGGLLRIKNMPDQRDKYKLEEVTLKAGVLSLVTDRFQDIVWIGTDGQGLYMYFNEASSLDAVLSSELPQAVKSPLTALYLDKNETLWIATAGEGVVNLHEYSPEKNSGSRSEQFSIYNSLLGSNSVYSFSPSSKNLLWVGTDNGLNYYSYNERRMRNMQIVADGKPLKQVRSVCELNDTTLWIATAGEGIVKARLAGTVDNPIITTSKRFTVNDGSPAANTFTVAYGDGDNTVWFGTQSSGVWKMDSRSERMENIQFSKGDNPALNNIHAIYKNNYGYWFGTSDGLAFLANGQKTVFNESNGLPCKVVHGILEDSSGNLWLSTNRGIVKFNQERHSPHLCKQSEDKSVSEFTSGAYYKDSQRQMLLFGGANGFVTVNENEFVLQDFTPAIRFTGLSIFGKPQNINQYMSRGHKQDVVRLDNGQNVFSISFVATDFIDGGEYTYFYKLNEQSDNWVDNGRSNTAFFTYLNPGSYTLSTKYRNNVTGKESPVYTLKVKITPLWYRSWWAYILYVLLLALVIYGIRWFILWQMRRKEKSMAEAFDKRFVDETDKLKLQFFANMANEFYAPLMLILNPVRKLLGQPTPAADPYIYANAIQQSAMQLDEFIRDMSELRLLENGERQPNIQTLPVSELTDSIAGSYIPDAATRQVDYQIKIDAGIYWNTDSYCIRSILSNLLAHAFVNVNNGGMVSIHLSATDEELRMVITNNGMNGDKERMFDILSNLSVVEILESQARQGYPVRNELTLAICHSMIVLLKGHIKVDTEGDVITFTVSLPQLEATADDIILMDDERPIITYKQVTTPPVIAPAKDPQKINMLVVTADRSLAWLLTDQFGMHFNIDLLGDASQLPDLLKTARYGLIMATVNLPGSNGIDLVKSLKSDPAYSSVPCILMASENTLDEREQAAEAKVELYVAKPYDMEMLEKELDCILQYKELQSYHSSALSRTFELGDEHFASKDDKGFYQQMISIIDRNLTNSALSVEMICDELQYNSQQFYIKLSEITRKTPNEIIREYRLNTVELLLVSTSLPVDEIIEKAGFSSRSNFFKVFSQKYGMTPRNYREQKKKLILKEMGEKNL